MSRQEWLTRLQRVNLRTKIVVPTIFLAVLPTALVGGIAIDFVKKTLLAREVTQTEFRAASDAAALSTFVQELHRDLRVVSDLPDLETMAAAAGTESAALEALRTKLERDLAVFAQGRAGYSALRFLDSEAREILRLDRVAGEDRLEPTFGLESKRDPHYSQAMEDMEEDRIYVSQLSAVTGVDGDAKPILSCAIPVEAAGGPGAPGRGLLVVDVDPERMVSMLGDMPPGAEAWLVDADGMYMAYIGASEEKRMTYSLAARRFTSDELDSETLRRIRGGLGEVRTVKHGSSLLTAVTFTPDAAVPDRPWTLLVSRPLVSLFEPAERLSHLLWGALAAVLALAGAAGILIAHYVSRPLALLRAATVEIAGGDLSKEVEVTTGDEIEGLAHDFNRMTRRLRQAHEELAAWNERLRRRVVERTQSLHDLQTGLARADKLATVGQMAASVMHEIGNPLAAIKTKIQVAEEGRDLDPRTSGLLSEVLGEVDRLAHVLRSFTRLGRLGSDEIRPVSLSDIVRGVQTLVEPELRRKGITLLVDAAPGVPEIEGDPDRLRQLLINLILNAAEASEGTATVSVHLGTESDSAQEGPRDRVVVRVEDRGKGISHELLGKIWNPLFTTKPDGTGLGLAICKEIVDDHGGSAHVDSEVGVGTTVTLRFPPVAAGGSAGR